MLQGRVAPPSSPAVAAATDDAVDPPKPLSISRRNSFSRDMAESIAQARTQAFGSTPSDSIRLHVNDAVRPLSPRRSSSFSLPRTPRQDDSHHSSSSGGRAVLDDATRVLRPTMSEFRLRPPTRESIDRPVVATATISHAAAPSSQKHDVWPLHEDADLLTLDSPGRANAHLPLQQDEAAQQSSPESSSYSAAASPTEGEELVGGDDVDAFETWLQEARVLESPVKEEVAKPVADELAAWLHREPTPTIELSKSVQQIEHEIRTALDSAATRVTSGAERRGQFHEALESALHGTPGAFSAAPLAPPSEPELLLLMEVLIGDGRSETIEIHVGDAPARLAQAFATKHGLVADAVPRLTQHIQDQLDALDGDAEEEGEEAAGDSVCGDRPSAVTGVAPSARIEGGQRGYDESHGDALHDYHDNRYHHDHDDDDDDDRDDDGRSASGMMDEYERGERRQHAPPPPPMSTKANHHDQTHSQPLPAAPTSLGPQREHEREHSYNHLMEKYGHYTSHSNKVNPTHQPPPPLPSGAASDPLTMRNLELSEQHARLLFTPRPAAVGRHHTAGPKDKDSVYHRLYSLAEAREKWIRRQQKAKAADEVRERQAMMKLELSAKSRDLIAARGTGGYAHIGERLYDEALSDLAKKQRERERRELERAQQLDWTCPKCASVNGHGDAACRNVVAMPPSDAAASHLRRAGSPAVDAVCGHARPEQLFRPTLVSASASNAAAVHPQRQRAPPASSQRQRTAQQMEDEFRQTCPFKPKINELSEEIMRDKLALEARASGNHVTTTAAGDVRRRDPHRALYEDAFHARAQREAKEEAYLKQFPFKPDIGVNALWSKPDDATDGGVVERLAVARFRELERKRASLHEKYAPDRDPATGRAFFTPETGRAPVFNRNERGLPIGEFLYEAHKEHAEYHRRLRAQDEADARQRAEQTFLSAKSRQVLETRKKKTFARLFQRLRQATTTTTAAAAAEERDDEPRVVPVAVDLAALPVEIARIASIVFEFARHEPFAFAAFEQFMERLMTDVPGLTYTQVLFLTDGATRGKGGGGAESDPAADGDDDDAELTFRPAIDKNSDALAKKHGRADRASVFVALNQYYEHYKDRQEAARRQREREFARAHPFQPTFVSKDRQTKAASFYKKLRRRELAASGGGDKDRDGASALRTAVPNARPFVRPLDRSPSTQQLRSRSSSLESSKHSDDEDAVLTSHVLAALDDRPAGGGGGGGGGLPPPPLVSATVSGATAAFSALFSPSSSQTSVSSSVMSLASAACGGVMAMRQPAAADAVSLSDLAR